MPRPPIKRRIGQAATVTYFKPRGTPLRMLETVELAADELEALRLADLEEMYQEEAAQQMGISRQTLGLILKRAHKKVADALTTGKAICIEDGETDPDGVPPPNTGRGGGYCHGRGPGGGRGRRGNGPQGSC